MTNYKTNNHEHYRKITRFNMRLHLIIVPALFISVFIHTSNGFWDDISNISAIIGLIFFYASYLYYLRGLKETLRTLTSKVTCLKSKSTDTNVTALYSFLFIFLLYSLLFSDFMVDIFSALTPLLFLLYLTLLLLVIYLFSLAFFRLNIFYTSDSLYYFSKKIPLESLDPYQVISLQNGKVELISKGEKMLYRFELSKSECDTLINAIKKAGQ